jgi:hypothetical protein
MTTGRFIGFKILLKTVPIVQLAGSFPLILLGCNGKELFLLRPPVSGHKLDDLCDLQSLPNSATWNIPAHQR